MKKRKKMVKIAAMHKEYGENEGSMCKNCCNLIHKRVDGEHFKGEVCKCVAYGAWRGRETDWKEDYTGCGLYNMPFNETSYKSLGGKIIKKIGDDRDERIRNNKNAREAF